MGPRLPRPPAALPPGLRTGVLLDLHAQAEARARAPQHPEALREEPVVLPEAQALGPPPERHGRRRLQDLGGRGRHLEHATGPRPGPRQPPALLASPPPEPRQRAARRGARLRPRPGRPPPPPRPLRAPR